MPSVVRHPLLTAHLSGEPSIERVEVKRIEFSAGQQSGLHLHPCTVVGLITQGTILFQVDGEPLQTLKAGDVPRAGIYEDPSF